MNKRTFSIAGIGLAAILGLTIAASNSHAGFLDKLRKDKRGHDASAEGRLVTAAAEFSGSLRGEIRVQDKKFLVTHGTSVYVIGKGFTKEQSMFVHKRPMVVRGRMVDGVLLAEMIIVRPEKAVSMRSSAPSRPHTPSPANANVGVLEGDDE